MKKVFIFMEIFLAITVFGKTNVSKIELKGGDAASKRAYLAQSIRFWGYDGYPTDPNQRMTLVTLGNSKVTYVFFLNGKKTKNGRWAASLGMVKPSEANWYHNSFFSFEVNKIKNSDCNVELCALQSGTDVGSFVIRYTANGLKADLKLALEEDDDKLMVSFLPHVGKKVSEHYWVKLRCYPGSMGGGYAAGLKLRQREALTSVGKYSLEGVKLTAKEYWVMFYDKYFDVKFNRGTGPCAVLFNPKETWQTELFVKNFACDIKFYYALQQPAYLVLWDFKGWSNDAAKNFLQKLDASF